MLKLFLHYCRVWLFYILSVVLGIASWFILCPLLFTRSGAFFIIKVWAVVGVFLLRVFCGIKVELHNKDKLTDLGMLIACKHQSTLEIIALCKYVKNPVFFMKKTLLYVPFLNIVLWRSRHLYVDRKKGGNAHLFDQAVESLKDSNVIIFPEGTRNQVNHHNPIYRSGIVIVAQKAGADIIPISTNTGVFWKRRTILKQAGVAVLNILDKVQLSDNTMQELKDKIEADTLQLIKNAQKTN